MLNYDWILKPSCPNYYIFPIKKFTELSDLCICCNCLKIYIDHPDSNDYGICSIDCGYEIRGISYSDFL